MQKYEIVPADERALFDHKAAGVADFAKRRELKINQYKKEKDLKARIEVSRYHCTSIGPGRNLHRLSVNVEASGLPLKRRQLTSTSLYICFL